MTSARSLGRLFGRPRNDCSTSNNQPHRKDLPCSLPGGKPYPPYVQLSWDAFQVTYSTPHL
ncbi:hypothetical protein SCLCIDRAFT_1221738 [Scleroderma citrinum Foug A]|uniref:Uncharacterized protein n=1 Tax=Scleroderma citrinum Foug A TaxID=1036808 RepID=A0A0C2ZQ53_9AGAM|nr:hypothetical protein SCLCIDRAFT_1221738 [Scleroderma citrinum Foug A]